METRRLTKTQRLAKAVKATTVALLLADLCKQQEAIPANENGIPYWDNLEWQELDRKINTLKLEEHYGRHY